MNPNKSNIMHFSHITPISPVSLNYLIENWPIGYSLLDVRGKEEFSLGSIESSFNLPLDIFFESLQFPEGEFSKKFGFDKPPIEDNLIVCCEDGQKGSILCAEKSRECGYKRVHILEGGIKGYVNAGFQLVGKDNSMTIVPPSYPFLSTERLKDMLRDASVKNLIVLDVRRKDELQNFGVLDCAKNIPTEVFSHLFSLGEEEFLSHAGFQKPGKESQIILYCRSNRRAKYVFLLAFEFGYRNIFVFKDGVMGLSQIDQKVIPYESYDVTDPIPAPLPSPPPLS
eukprot:TRINITY_DN1048_c0_g1_i2.p1 TRINITY_DN1048_c0_g1~~TRINITY_DN1048_c0_g1_i2.p1  ORF type:complete len:283 (-),score=40.46 TRINITY_DN1048_c0_g1_i2:556-1404(-)